jgi:hypothetical protein
VDSYLRREGQLTCPDLPRPAQSQKRHMQLWSLRCGVASWLPEPHATELRARRWWSVALQREHQGPDLVPVGFGLMILCTSRSCRCLAVVGKRLGDGLSFVLASDNSSRRARLPRRQEFKSVQTESAVFNSELVQVSVGLWWILKDQGRHGPLNAKCSRSFLPIGRDIDRLS